MMKFRYTVSLCIGILIILLIGNRFLTNQSTVSNGNQVNPIKFQKVEWNLSTKTNTQKVDIHSKSISVPQRDEIKVFITSESLKSYKVIEPIYNGKNRFTFNYHFKKKTPYFVSIFINNQTIDTKIFQKNKEQKQALFPTSILTKKFDDFQVSLLFDSLLTKNKNTLNFEFTNFKGHHPKMSNHQIYIVSEDGSFFKILNSSSNKTKLKYELTLQQEEMYKIFYEFNLNNKKESFSYIIDVKDKVN